MKKIYLSLILLLLTASLFAQLKPEAALAIFGEKYPVESIFLHYDKEQYIAGETIHFKSYVFSDFSTSRQSTNLYVELYNAQKKLLDKTLLPLLNGAGNGTLTLKEDLPEGVYYIRAYTGWSLNFGNELPYIRALPIYNPASLTRLVPKPVQWTAYAFPESGNLIAGIQNKVAVRLFTKSQLPNSWRGMIMKKGSAETVAEFTSFNKEIGLIQFVPEAGASYGLKIVDNLGNQQTISLQVPAASGIAMQTQRRDSEMVCRIIFKDLPKGEAYKLIGQMENSLVYMAKLKAGETEVTARIPVSQLVSGVLHLTLFDKADKPVAERLCFVEVEEAEKIIVRTDSFSSAKRGLNSYAFSVDTSALQTYTAFVIDTTAISPKETFLSALWLSKDVSYASAEASHYFDKTKNDRQVALDAFLIANGWRWFNWKELTAGNFPVITHQPDNYLSFTGTVFLGRKMQLNKPVNLIFRIEDSTTSVTQTKTDSTASFYIEGATFHDTAGVYYQLGSKRAAANAIKIYFESNNKFQRLHQPLPAAPYAVVQRLPGDSVPLFVQRQLAAYRNQAKVDKRYRQLQEVIVRTRLNSKKEALNKKLSSSAFRSLDERVYDFTDTRTNASGYQDVVEWSRVNIPGLSMLPLFRGSPVTIFLDEMRSDVIAARMVSMNDVALVKFVRSGGGLIGANGALLIYTKRGGESQDPFRGLPNGRIAGYRRVVPFPFVDHAADLYKSFDDDNREVLYWNPQLTPDTKGESQIRFYNNDRPSRYKLVIFGFTADGKPVYTEKEVGSETPDL